MLFRKDKIGPAGGNDYQLKEKTKKKKKKNQSGRAESPSSPFCLGRAPWSQIKRRTITNSPTDFLSLAPYAIKGWGLELKKHRDRHHKSGRRSSHTLSAIGAAGLGTFRKNTLSTSSWKPIDKNVSRPETRENSIISPLSVQPPVEWRTLEI